MLGGGLLSAKQKGISPQKENTISPNPSPAPVLPAGVRVCVCVSLGCFCENPKKMAVDEAKTMEIVQNALDDALLAGRPFRKMVEQIVAQSAKDTFMEKMEKAFPYQKTLNKMTPAQFTQAWKRLTTDTENWEALADSFQNAATANIFALSIANPGNEELEKLQHASMLRSAPKVSWKSICDVSKGGGPDRLQIFLAEKADDVDDNVKALARSILHLYAGVEKRFVDPNTTKKSRPEKTEQQRRDMMPFVYECIKSYKRRTTKPSASVAIDNEMLIKLHGTDIFAALSRMVANGQRISSGPQDSAKAGPPAKRQRDDAPSSAPPQSRARFDARETVLKELRNEAWKLRNDPDGIRAWADAQFADPQRRSTIQTILREDVCRNCLYGGSGAQSHSLQKCKERNECHLVCPICKKKKGTTEKHWMEKCPNK